MNGQTLGDRAGPRFSLQPGAREPLQRSALDPRAADASSFESGPLTPSREPPVRPRAASSMRTAIYLIGLLTILAALAWAALLLGVPSEWIGVGLLFGLGITLIKGTRYTPHRR